MWIFCFYSDGQRLKAKQWSADATEEEEENKWGWDFGLYMFSISGWTADWSVDEIWDKWMYVLEVKKKESNFCSLAGACTVRTNSKDWVWFIQCITFFIYFNVWLKKNRLARHLKALYKLSWEFPPLVLLLETFPAFFQPMQNEQHKRIWVPTDKDFSRGVRCYKNNMLKNKSPSLWKKSKGEVWVQD